MSCKTFIPLRRPLLFTLGLVAAGFLSNNEGFCLARNLLSSDCAKQFDQCGGNGFMVSQQCCNSGDSCLVKNHFYAQCLSEDHVKDHQNDMDWDGTILKNEPMPLTVLKGPHYSPSSTNNKTKDTEELAEVMLSSMLGLGPFPKKCREDKVCGWCEECTDNICTVVLQAEPDNALLASWTPSTVSPEMYDGFTAIRGFEDFAALYNERRLETTEEECVDQCRDDSRCGMILWIVSEFQLACTGGSCVGTCYPYPSNYAICPGSACYFDFYPHDRSFLFVKNAACGGDDRGVRWRD